MATIDDFGDTADPLNAPALGGASGWAAAVRDYLKDLMARKVEKAGDTMTGDLTINKDTGDPALRLSDSYWVIQPHPTTKDLYVSRPGVVSALIVDDTTGLTKVPGDPTDNLGIATRQYVDAKGTWQDYDPVVLQGNTVTYTRTQARYTRIGNLVTVECRLEITSAGTASQAVTVSMPLPMATANGVPIGVGRVTIESKLLVSAVVADTGSHRVSFKHMPDTANNFGVGAGSGSSAALASGNQIVFTCTYETDAA